MSLSVAGLAIAAADAARGQDAPAALQSQSGAELYTAGCERLRSGRPIVAIELLSRAVAKRPGQVGYALKLAEAYTAAGQGRSARRLLENLHGREPHDVSVCLALAHSQVRDESWKAAMDTLSRVEERLGVDGVLLLATALRRAGTEARSDNALKRGLGRHRRSEPLWLAYIDAALRRHKYSLSLRRIAEAERRIPSSARISFRAAQAYFRMRRVLGAARVRAVRDGRVGQFSGQWLLVERRAGRDRFLCCPPASALYQMRRALDAGLDEPNAHLLYARIWRRAERPMVGFAVLRSREPILLESPTAPLLRTYSNLALAAGALRDYLRYARMAAQLEPERGDEILYTAYRSAGERYNQRGEDVVHAELLRRALALRPGETDLALELADAEWALGRREAAARLYGQVLAARPAHERREGILERLAGEIPADPQRP